ncbi:hypothetical protein ASPZODRAFT_69760 [Penicilliopsis zonata CBS 506.65]|uniref:NADH:flavin oxidoreductase/NADH oxidase N-terminal domain-containing protein n=1 Tax=Penicilliopsis zonata CBS 506.65 TaxID=1073090 RepID=A0A1L9SDN1_9EURO|nr:hypothetical protein ASPZODRAFT_69760 [Penicilliopsis zonata CBS 506.65]OJJ45248.1 hypothetical protein ASPZODRAFT_69760 [Penicilliopsis zonata CBS 506.65]
MNPNNAGQALLPSQAPTLFRPLSIRAVTFKNRIFVSPMCMYSAASDPAHPDCGALTDFHLAHLGHLAIKGVGLVIIEATAVQPCGRISPNDAGLWSSKTASAGAGNQLEQLQKTVAFLHSQGAKVGLQLAHAGRKASTLPPWISAQARAQGTRIGKADRSVNGWPEDVVGPSGGVEQRWSGEDDEASFWPPRELSIPEIEEIVRAFAASAARAVQAGVDVLEIHAAHGYLLHQFLSPVTNRRRDAYGGSFDNRIRLLREIVAAVRAAIPTTMPLFLRISATEWLEDSAVARACGGSWDLAATRRLLPLLPDWGVDFLDVSSGGNHRHQRITPHPTYQVDLAAQLRREMRAQGIMTLVGAVGLITQAHAASAIPQQPDEEAQAAENMLSGSQPCADAVLMARQFLREPEWVINAAKTLGVEISVPVQFARALT